MDSRICRLSFREAAIAIADLLMPRLCVVCGRKLLLRERHLCTECLADLPLTRFSLRRDNPMSAAFNEMIQREINADGEGGYEPFCHAASLIFYSGGSPYKNIPRKLKYGRNFAEGEHFARMLGRELAASPLFADADAIVPVPLHRARRRQRGYNQAEVIARAIAREMAGAKLVCKKLKRVKRTESQTRLQKGERYANVKSAFVAKAFDPMPKHVLLVDDVYTTGATLCACQRALRKVLPPEVRISAATLAFVGG